jgi:MYXO-CTERM domain-containing protein
LEIDVTVPDPEEILAACEGFLVDASNGRDIGVVEEVETGPDGAAVSLLVAGGWFGRRRRRIPVDAIEAIDPDGRRVVVRA